MAEATETGVAVNYLDSFAYDDVPKDWKEGEDSGHCRLPVNDQEWHMIDFEAVGEVMYPCTAFVRMSDYDHFMPSVDKLGRKLIDVTLNSSWLGKEEVAAHGNVVGHVDGTERPCSAEQQSRKCQSWRCCFGSLHAETQAC